MKICIKQKRKENEQAEVFNSVNKAGMKSVSYVQKVAGAGIVGVPATSTIVCGDYYTVEMVRGSEI